MRGCVSGQGGCTQDRRLTPNPLPCRAEAILEEAGREVVSAVGMDSTQYTALQHMLMTVLHAAGSWERCAEVAAAAAPVIVRVHGRVSNAHAQCLLRLAAAQVGCGTVDSVNAAGPTLGTCSEYGPTSHPLPQQPGHRRWVHYTFEVHF